MMTHIEIIAIKDKEIAELKAQIEILNQTKHTEREILDKFVIPEENEELEIEKRKETDKSPTDLEFERDHLGGRENSVGLWSTEKWTDFKRWFLHIVVIEAMVDGYMTDYYEGFRICEGKVDENWKDKIGDKSI